MSKFAEENLHRSVCDFIRLKYPGALFTSDVGSGSIRLTKGQAGRFSMLRSGRGWPDLFIAEPRGEYYGLFIEIKVESRGVVLKNGQMSVKRHIQEQSAMLDSLNERGYFARFGFGVDHCREIIDWYMRGADLHESVS